MDKMSMACITSPYHLINYLKKQKYIIIVIVIVVVVVVVNINYVCNYY